MRCTAKAISMDPHIDFCDEYKKKPYESYTAYVAARTRRNPCLENLHSFLANANSHQRTCQVACLEFSSISGITVQKSLELNNLAIFSHNKIEGLRGRLLIVEDLSVNVIEILGSTLNLDPFFFASHIDVAQTDIRSKRPCTAGLPSMKKSRNFLSLHYHRVLKFEHPPPQRKLFRDMNIPRKVISLPSIRGINIGLARHCCSILETVGNDGLWLGIILVDTPFSDSFSFRGQCNNMTTAKLQSRPFQGGFEDYDSSASFLDGYSREPSPERRSLFEDLVHCWRNKEPQSFDMNSPTLVSLSYYPLRIIATEWMMYLEAMYYSIKQHEYAPTSIPAALRQVTLLNTDLYALQAWSRRSMETSFKIQDVISFLNHQKNQDRDVDSCKLLIEDYEFIASRVESYSARFEASSPIVTSLIQIIDSQQSLRETANITRLTYLALIFLPLTFVSGLLSMNEQSAPGNKVICIYLVIAIPICTLVLCVAYPLRRTLDFLATQVSRLRRPNRTRATIDKPQTTFQ